MPYRPPTSDSRDGLRDSPVVDAGARSSAGERACRAVLHAGVAIVAVVAVPLYARWARTRMERAIELNEPIADR